MTPGFVGQYEKLSLKCTASPFLSLLHAAEPFSFHHLQHVFAKQLHTVGNTHNAAHWRQLLATGWHAFIHVCTCCLSAARQPSQGQPAGRGMLNCTQLAAQRQQQAVAAAAGGTPCKASKLFQPIHHSPPTCCAALSQAGGRSAAAGLRGRTQRRFQAHRRSATALRSTQQTIARSDGQLQLAPHGIAVVDRRCRGCT